MKRLVAPKKGAKPALRVDRAFQQAERRGADGDDLPSPRLDLVQRFGDALRDDPRLRDA